MISKGLVSNIVQLKFSINQERQQYNDEFVCVYVCVCVCVCV